ncbi:tumor necrosis factor receptor superfamily member 3-like isoform X2 [Callorhinchus milii]|nr:tumor necrosis factor receptor superfamily member 3-like isoform X2 [Callorhinchus milii]|eukprot:gi/632968089/ref/XP_007900338.1/ PREDICTED: tumor necrosis factor receptor superfamily member 3-like isoform X2 [Callorhinchus milii]
MSGLQRSKHRYFKREVSSQIQCVMCLPGEYRAQPCSGGNQGKCERCDPETYTEMNNSLSECRKCYGPCEGNIVETVECTPKTNRKCECPPQYYCLTEDKTKCERCQKCQDKKKHFSEHQRIHYNEACQLCPSGTFQNITGIMQRCQPHTNCTNLGKILHIIGNSSADNHCISPSSSSTPTPSTNQYLPPSKSFSSFYIMWPLVFLFMLCIVILMKTKSCQIVRKKQGLGVLVKLKFICICGTKSDLNTNNNPGVEQREGMATGEGLPCEDEGFSDLKPPLPTTNESEIPQFKTEIIDIETVADSVHTKRSIEENIPFPVQENGRNSNIYYPIEEQGRKQYCQLTMLDTKCATQTQSPFLSARKYLQDQSPLKSHFFAVKTEEFDNNPCI